MRYGSRIFGTLDIDAFFSGILAYHDAGDTTLRLESRVRSYADYQKYTAPISWSL